MQAEILKFTKIKQRFEKSYALIARNMQEIIKKGALGAVNSLKVTEHVSRVLYALTQQSSIFTARYRTVQALRLCHHESDGQSADKIGDQGVASDRVYSEPMLP